MYGNTSDGSMGFLKFLVCLVILGIVLFAVLPIIGDIIKGEITFGSIPMTDHAVKSHAEQNWNATTIEKYFDDGNCTPNSCISGDTTIYYCEYDKQPKYSLVLIVGKTVEQVITGFMTNTSRVGKLCTR